MELPPGGTVALGLVPPLKVVMFPAKPTPAQFDTVLSLPRSRSMEESPRWESRGGGVPGAGSGQLTASTHLANTPADQAMASCQTAKMRKSTTEINMAGLSEHEQLPVIMEWLKRRRTRRSVVEVLREPARRGPRAATWTCRRAKGVSRSLSPLQYVKCTSRTRGE